MSKSRLITPGQAHSAGGMVSDKLMQWGADKIRVQEWMDNEKHPLWTEMMRQLAIFRTISSMIEEGGYEEVHEGITERNFPGKCEFGENPTLMKFHRNDLLEAVIIRISEAGKRPATIWDLLDFGINREIGSLIIALGSQVWFDGNFQFWCPTLSRSNSSKKKVGVIFLLKNRILNSDCHLLVVDK